MFTPNLPFQGNFGSKSYLLPYISGTSNVFFYEFSSEIIYETGMVRYVTFSKSPPKNIFNVFEKWRIFSPVVHDVLDCLYFSSFLCFSWILYA